VRIRSPSGTHPRPTTRLLNRSAAHVRVCSNRPDRDAEVVLVGRSNVGKSTLMRELTGHDFSTGGKPGVTRQPNHFDWASESFMFTDLPGFGFMSGVEEEHREAIKTNIVRYLEENADSILAGVVVMDGKAAVDIIDRHAERGNIPTTWRCSAS